LANFPPRSPTDPRPNGGALPEYTDSPLYGWNGPTPKCLSLQPGVVTCIRKQEEKKLYRRFLNFWSSIMGRKTHSFVFTNCKPHPQFITDVVANLGFAMKK